MDSRGHKSLKESILTGCSVRAWITIIQTQSVSCEEQLAAWDEVQVGWPTREANFHSKTMMVALKEAGLDAAITSVISQRENIGRWQKMWVPFSKQFKDDVLEGCVQLIPFINI